MQTDKSEFDEGVRLYGMVISSYCIFTNSRHLDWSCLIDCRFCIKKVGETIKRIDYSQRCMYRYLLVILCEFISNRCIRHWSSTKLMYLYNQNLSKQFAKFEFDGSVIV